MAAATQDPFLSRMHLKVAGHWRALADRIGGPEFDGPLPEIIDPAASLNPTDAVRSALLLEIARLESATAPEADEVLE